ncbi:hypothetical protein MSAN_00745000 [Mycena sanguinolenta]|uniref:F-box domain-containing protein n=1 Tax=Mycena sanguinolenta TaxID=230812 RepID=A0A8H6Z5C1_9AGAR|nr:hypothetical protein MSAN_00745000 [Mycena sanguinolenta]
MSIFLNMPSDILLLIISTYLDIPDVYAFRRVCRELAQLTRDKFVWLTRLERLRARGDIPLPTVDTAVDPSSTLESIVVSASRACESWRLPRQINPILRSPGGKIKGLKMFLDTWLLIVYQDGGIYLWDIRENMPQRGHCAILRMVGARWQSYDAALGPGEDHIIVALSSALEPGVTECETRLYCINVGGDTFELFRSFKHSLQRKILAIDTVRRLLVFSSSTRALGIIDWDNEEAEDENAIVLDDADTEEIVNDVIALRRIDVHLLLIRTRTIEFYLCSDAYRRQPTIPPLRHRLPWPLRDGAVSVSDVVPASSDDRTRVTFLAYTGQSLTCYTIAIELPEADNAIATPALMDVTLVGEAHPPPGTLPPWFVSAHALGPQGIRAMWIDRDQTMTRHVRLCTFNSLHARHDMGSEAFSSTVFSLSSYDLREDLTHCALAESSGRIALGNRVGDVFLLPVNRTEQQAN